MVQTLHGPPASPTFTAPIRAGEHYIPKGDIQTVIGGQCGDRALGDFLQLRIGSHGEAQISYADSNNADEPFAPHAMYVKQNGGAGRYALRGGDRASSLAHPARRPAGAGKRETHGGLGPDPPRPDILHSHFS